MRQLIGRLISLSTIIFSLVTTLHSKPANAVMLFPYMGLDFNYVRMKPKARFGPLFPSSFPGFNFFLGTQFHENFGFEVGYGWSLKQSRSWIIGQNQVVAGTISTTSFVGETKIRRSNAYLDLILFLPVYNQVCDALEMLFSLGFGWVQPQITTRLGIHPTGSIPHSSAIASMGCKGKGVIRAGFGAKYMLTEVFGIRGKINYETTSFLRMRGNNYFQQVGFSNRGFKMSTVFLAGVFWKF